MAHPSFPLEKIFGSRTRVKVMTLFTTGVKRPYYVREIARTVNERLNAVRRELEILMKIGMLTAYHEKRRKYYVADESFTLFEELASIMQKSGPGVEDAMFKGLEDVGDLLYVCLSGYFTHTKDSPTDLFIIGTVNESKLDMFVKRVERQLGHEITYTPMTENEYRYRRNFNDSFLRHIFLNPHKEMINKLETSLQPMEMFKKTSTLVVRTGA